MVAAAVTFNRFSKKHLVLLFVVAFTIRALTFFSYIRHHEYYKQADSIDYHNGALCMTYGFGMHRPNPDGTIEPIFWRTPGYPLYLSIFYKFFGIYDTSFEGSSYPQQASIWVQIFLCSFIPIILLYLAFALTASVFIAYTTAWISVFHIGLVLTSTYLLTEGIALIPFYLFLLYFYRSFTGILEQPQQNHAWKKQLLLAAIMLSVLTWIRPMGQFVAVLAVLIIILFAQDTRKLKAKKIALFGLCFFMLISPWYIRNYRLTGSWFFCPMFGTYLNAFCAPRIVSSLEQVELIQAWRKLGMNAEIRYRTLKPTYKRLGLVLPKEFVCGTIAWPIFLGHPWLAFYDWMREVFKTTFDLYASQLVALVKGCFFYDPIIEYLTEKIQECLYKTPMHWFMRSIVYLELIYALLLWVGLFGGLFMFMLIPLIRRLKVSSAIQRQCGLWLKVTPIIAGVLFMTGGFGYARLRLPVEPLMIILSLTFWLWTWQKKKSLTIR